MEKHFVTFYSPGTFCAETTTKEIDNWDVNTASEMAKEIIERYSAKPYGFAFSTRGRNENELDSRKTKESGMYYINGVIQTLEEIKALNDSNNRILIANMEGNGWDKVVTTYNSYKWTQPFKKNDCIVEIK